MKFQIAQCVNCLGYSFDESEVLAYRIAASDGGARNPEAVDLGGESPYAGVRCVCFKCLAFFAAHAPVEALAHAEIELAPGSIGEALATSIHYLEELREAIGETHREIINEYESSRQDAE